VKTGKRYLDVISKAAKRMGRAHRRPARFLPHGPYGNALRPVKSGPLVDEVIQK